MKQTSKKITSTEFTFSPLKRGQYSRNQNQFCIAELIIELKGGENSK